MNTKIIKFALTSIFILGIILGAQIDKVTLLHTMDGNLMTEHDMPINDCGSETCVMLPSSAAPLQITQTLTTQAQDQIAIKAYLLIFLLIAINLLSLRKYYLSSYLTGSPTFKTESVILRE